VSISLRADDIQPLHGQLKADGVPILTEPFDTPFGSPSPSSTQTVTPPPFTARPERERPPQPAKPETPNTQF